MTEQPLAEDLRLFIIRNISSIEQLEVLFLLRRLAPKTRTAGEVARELTSSRYSIEQRLFDLMTRHLLVSRPRGDELEFCYHPGPYDDVIARLAEEYAKRRVAVIMTIFDVTPHPERPATEVFRVKRRDGAWTSLLSATNPYTNTRH